jgi:hypothetical protein
LEGSDAAGGQGAGNSAQRRNAAGLNFTNDGQEVHGVPLRRGPVDLDRGFSSRRELRIAELRPAGLRGLKRIARALCD